METFEVSSFSMERLRCPHSNGEIEVSIFSIAKKSNTRSTKRSAWGPGKHRPSATGYAVLPLQPDYPYPENFSFTRIAC